jgi:starch synthase
MYVFSLLQLLQLLLFALTLLPPPLLLLLMLLRLLPALCLLWDIRYGAVPVVRKTGGLADTVRDVDSHSTGQGNGYTFDGTDQSSLFSALDRSLAHFKEQPSSWGELSLCNMNTELSWSRSAADYVALYNSIAMP